MPAAGRRPGRRSARHPRAEPPEIATEAGAGLVPHDRSQPLGSSPAGSATQAPSRTGTPTSKRLRVLRPWPHGSRSAHGSRPRPGCPPGGRRWDRRPPARTARVRSEASPRPTDSPPSATASARSSRTLPGSCTAPGLCNGAGAADIGVSRPALRAVSTSRTPPACETTAPRPPGRGQAETTRYPRSPGEYVFPCSGQAPRQVTSLQVSSTLHLFDQDPDESARDSARLKGGRGHRLA